MPKIERQTIENIKTVTIAVLITAIIAFIAGNIYAGDQQARVEAAANAKSSVTATTKK